MMYLGDDNMVQIDDIKDVIDGYFVMFALDSETPVKVLIEQVDDQHRVRLESEKIYQKNIQNNDKIGDIMYFNTEELLVRTNRRYMTSAEFRKARSKGRIEQMKNVFTYKFKIQQQEDVMDVIMIFENYFNEILT